MCNAEKAWTQTSPNRSSSNSEASGRGTVTDSKVNLLSWVQPWSGLFLSQLPRVLPSGQRQTSTPISAVVEIMRIKRNNTRPCAPQHCASPVNTTPNPSSRMNTTRPTLEIQLPSCWILSLSFSLSTYHSVLLGSQCTYHSSDDKSNKPLPIHSTLKQFIIQDFFLLMLIVFSWLTKVSKVWHIHNCSTLNARHLSHNKKDRQVLVPTSLELAGLTHLGPDPYHGCPRNVTSLSQPPWQSAVTCWLCG